MGRRPRAALVAAAAAVVCALAALPALAGGGPAVVTVVSDHLNNPRGVAAGPDGAIYVAQAGKAGPNCRAPGECYGTSGRVTRVDEDGRRAVVKGLISVGGRDGLFTTGPDGVGVAPDGTVFVAMTGAGCGSVRGIPTRLKRQLGRLLRIEDGKPVGAGNIARVECTTNPDGTDRNPNPYAVLALADKQIVVDAGANALFEVQNRQVSLLAVLPENEGRHSVPTSIALGPDGNYYVGEFGGEGDGPLNGQSRVFKVTPDGDVSVYAAGFTAVTGVAFGPDGALYVTQWSDDLTVEQPSGSVGRVAGDGTRTT